MKNQRLIAYAQLLRLPNVFTAFADICLAGCAAGYIIDRPGVFVLLLLASGCFYLGGMVLNDFFDRREDAEARSFRPIPSGRVSARVALALGAVLLILGITLTNLAVASLFVLHVSWIVVTLPLAILLYDGWLKRTPLGPIGMGLCRFLNVELGLTGIWPEHWSPQTLHLASVVGVYIVGVTWFARTEESTSQRRQLVLAALVMLITVLGGLALPIHFTDRVAPWYFPYLVAGFLFLIGVPIVRAIQRPEPKRVQAAVKRCILGLVVLDAVLATAFVGWPGLLILLLLPPALWLGKWVYST